MAANLKAEVMKYVPPLIYAPQTRQLCVEDLSDLKAEFPLPSWTFARKKKDGSKMPQTIAHRGFKGAYPENTMLAFKQAVAAGVDAVETDVHVTRDGVAVLSHDGNLKRCFGRDENIIDCDWEYISTLRSLDAPHEPMPRLIDLLEYLAHPSQEHIWVLLDIKIDVEPTLMMSTIAQVLSSAPAPPARPWDQRILLGIWGNKYLPICKRLLPTYAVTNICFSMIYARQFLRHPYVSFNILATVVSLWPFGGWFIRAAHARSRSVLVWTVNDDRTARWAMENGVDGVITDDPRDVRRVADEWVAGKRDATLSRRQVWKSIWFNLMGIVFVFVLIHWRIRDWWAGRKPAKQRKFKQISGPGSTGAARMTNVF